MLFLFHFMSLFDHDDVFSSYQQFMFTIADTISTQPLWHPRRIPAGHTWVDFIILASRLPRRTRLPAVPDT